ncbi:MAG: hypothetical protein WB818_18005, partial [Desulfobacterales bacterium]
LCAGEPISDIKNRLGHENIQSTMTYLQMDLTHKRSIQEQFIHFVQIKINSGLLELIPTHKAHAHVLSLVILFLKSG